MSEEGASDGFEGAGWVPGRRRASFLVPLVVAVLAVALLAWWGFGGGSADDGDSAPVAETSAQTPQEEPSWPATPPDAASSDAGTPDPGADGSGDPVSSVPSDPEAARQASAMDGLLSASHRSRGDIQGAVDSARRCESAGVRELKEITEARADQLATARELTADALPGGEELKDALVEALAASRDADAGFLAWARRHRDDGCTGRPEDDPAYTRGMDRSVDAQAAKLRFAELWRPVADTFDLSYWKADDI
ncbi:hypothetical protein [Nonomuraea sp. NPDC048826]|uniref:hypothetical protein n=1 Tax=Nonomuraea sp. NPDC048826 TaxID=3364347 RepID=UPI003722FB28